MEELGPELKAELTPRLKGKPQERQRQWIQVGACGLGGGGLCPPSTLALALTQWLRLQISDAVYRMVYEQAKARFEAVLAKLQLARPAMEATIRTDMDQIITSKEHLASKIRGRAGYLLRSGAQGGPPVCAVDPCTSDLIRLVILKNENQPKVLFFQPLGVVLWLFLQIQTLKISVCLVKEVPVCRSALVGHGLDRGFVGIRLAVMMHSDPGSLFGVRTHSLLFPAPCPLPRTLTACSFRTCQLPEPLLSSLCCVDLGELTSFWCNKH